MAIALDTSSAKSTSAWQTGTSMTWAHTCTGSNLYLVVAVFVSEGDYVSGVTYNSVAMTQINKVNGGNGWEYLYGLHNPATGSNNIVVSMGTSSSFMNAFASSFTGVKQQTTPDASATNTSGSATSITSSITTIANNSWVIGFFRNSTGSAISSRTGITSRQAYTAGGLDYGDSNSAVNPAGSYSMTESTAPTSSTWGSCMLSIAPAPAYTLTTQVGAFTLTGQNVNLKRIYRIITQVGAFTLTGIDIFLRRAKRMSVEVGAFILTGKSINLITPSYWKWKVTNKGTSTFTPTDKSSEQIFTPTDKNY